MNLLGISLRRPGFDETTAASVMAVGLWLTMLGIAHAIGQMPERIEACALLLVCWWSCLGVRCGIDLTAGAKHWGANMLVAGALVTANDLAWHAVV